MNRLLRFSLLLLFVILAGSLSVVTRPCQAQPSDETQVAPRESEPWAASSHPVGDTIGRGIDFLLRPVYTGVSEAYFFVFRPPQPKHLTELRMGGCPALEPEVQEAPPEAEQQ
jgi:hypothetical protein